MNTEQDMLDVLRATKEKAESDGFPRGPLEAIEGPLGRLQDRLEHASALLALATQDDLDGFDRMNPTLRISYMAGIERIIGAALIDVELLIAAPASAR